MIIERISKSTGLDPDYVNKLVRSASHRYKVYHIPKKAGGLREIAHPSAELKLLQRWLVENVFSHFPVHESVYSYKRGVGIRDLAALHRNKSYLLRIDFKDFFPSIKGPDILHFLRLRANLLPFRLSEKDIKTIRSIVCRADCLTIGAPSSPAITNAILYDFDALCFEKARAKKAIYSRYADDIYFSCNRKGVLEEIYNGFKNDLKRLKSPKLKINERKTVFTSRKHTRIVTGLFLTSDKKISIGRTKKRYIRGMINRFIQGQLDEKELAYLRGFLAYVKGVEPVFLTRLRRKYGAKTIAEIMRATIVPRK